MARNTIESEFWTSNMADRSEMARNAIEGEFQTSKMTDLRPIDLKWLEIHFVKKIPPQKKVAYLSEMAITVIKSYFQTSKMAAGGHFVQNFKK